MITYEIQVVGANSTSIVIGSVKRNGNNGGGRDRVEENVRDMDIFLMIP